MACDGILFCFSTLLESINDFRDILGVLGIRHEMGVFVRSFKTYLDSFRDWTLPMGPRTMWWRRRMYSLFRRMREISPLPGNVCPKCMLFEIKMATSSSYASISGRNRAIQDTWRANLAAKAPFSRRAAQNHAWREETASAARLFRGSGPHSLAERALRPVVHAWLACRMCGPPAIGAHKMRGSPNRT